MPVRHSTDYEEEKRPQVAAFAVLKALDCGIQRVSRDRREEYVRRMLDQAASSAQEAGGAAKVKKEKKKKKPKDSFWGAADDDNAAEAKGSASTGTEASVAAVRPEEDEEHQCVYHSAAQVQHVKHALHHAVKQRVEKAATASTSPPPLSVGDVRDEDYDSLPSNPTSTAHDRIETRGDDSCHHAQAPPPEPSFRLAGDEVHGDPVDQQHVGTAPARLDPQPPSQGKASSTRSRRETQKGSTDGGAENDSAGPKRSSATSSAALYELPATATAATAAATRNQRNPDLAPQVETRKSTPRRATEQQKVGPSGEISNTNAESGQGVATVDEATPRKAPRAPPLPAPPAAVKRQPNSAAVANGKPPPSAEQETAPPPPPSTLPPAPSKRNQVKYSEDPFVQQLEARLRERKAQERLRNEELERRAVAFSRQQELLRAERAAKEEERRAEEHKKKQEQIDARLRALQQQEEQRAQRIQRLNLKVDAEVLQGKRSLLEAIEEKRRVLEREERKELEERIAAVRAKRNQQLSMDDIRRHEAAFLQRLADDEARRHQKTDNTSAAHEAVVRTDASKAMLRVLKQRVNEQLADEAHRQEAKKRRQSRMQYTPHVPLPQPSIHDSNLGAASHPSPATHDKDHAPSQDHQPRRQERQHSALSRTNSSSAHGNAAPDRDDGDVEEGEGDQGREDEERASVQHEDEDEDDEEERSRQDDDDDNGVAATSSTAAAVPQAVAAEDDVAMHTGENRRRSSGATEGSRRGSHRSSTASLDLHDVQQQSRERRRSDGSDSCGVDPSIPPTSTNDEGDPEALGLMSSSDPNHLDAPQPSNVAVSVEGRGSSESCRTTSHPTEAARSPATHPVPPQEENPVSGVDEGAEDQCVLDTKERHVITSSEALVSQQQPDTNRGAEVPTVAPTAEKASVRAKAQTLTKEKKAARRVGAK